MSFDKQLQRLLQAFGVHDMDTLAIRLGVQRAELARWEAGAPVPRAVIERAADRAKVNADWLACRAGARTPLQLRQQR